MQKEIALADIPNVAEKHFRAIDEERLLSPDRANHAPRILLLYGSLRERSCSRLMSEEAARILTRLGAETQTFSPSGLPLPDDAEEGHPKVQELRDLVTWCEGVVWCSPERHGAMTGIMKSQIDWIPLSLGGVRPTQGNSKPHQRAAAGGTNFNVHYAWLPIGFQISYAVALGTGHRFNGGDTMSKIDEPIMNANPT